MVLVDGVGVELLLQVVADGGGIGALEIEGAGAVSLLCLDGVGHVSAGEYRSFLRSPLCLRISQ